MMKIGLLRPRDDGKRVIFLCSLIGLDTHPLYHTGPCPLTMKIGFLLPLVKGKHVVSSVH